MRTLREIFKNLSNNRYRINFLRKIPCIQLFQLKLSPSKAEKLSAKSLLGVTIKNTQA